MNIYLFLYTFVSIASVLMGYFFIKKYNNISGYFFYFFVISASAWYMLYFIFFSGISNNAHFLLYISRLSFAFGVLSVYNLILFFKYFELKTTLISKKEIYGIITIYLLFSLYTIFSDGIIKGLMFDEGHLIFREIYGEHYFIVPILYIVFLLLFGYFGFKKIKNLGLLSGLRFRNIIFSSFIFLFSLIFLQVLLPLFNIWILEKEIIFLYVFFVVYIFFTIKRYYFSPLHQEYGFIKIGVIIISFVLSVSLLNLIKYFYSGIIPNSNSFWGFGDSFGIIDSIIYVATYSVFYGFLKKKYLINESEKNLKQSMDIIKQNISNTTSMSDLNKISQMSICSIFNTKNTKIILLQENNNFSELTEYFSRGLGEKIFINDIVFIEENKSKFDKNKIRQEVDSSTMLVFPIFKSESEIIGLFFIGKKPFGDFYTIDEISALLSFVKFLGLHLKYISTYTKIQEYSMTLDMRIDKKTIEYNDLINKQKEFISMISHEVRSPIGSAVFQIDSLIDDVKINKNISLEEITENLKAIGEQIANIGELLRKLFSVQYFDTRKVVLLKENVDIGLLLEKEFEIYSHMYQNITFIKKISTQIGCVNIDKIHFQQVLTNLLENAIKFASPEDPVILIELSKGINNTFLINIEDNGSGYGDMDPSVIFEKYSKGNHAKLGLGMGLYLCKRIVTMHDGKITANYGKILKGASFIIEIPI